MASCLRSLIAADGACKLPPLVGITLTARVWSADGGVVGIHAALREEPVCALFTGQVAWGCAGATVREEPVCPLFTVRSACNCAVGTTMREEPVCGLVAGHAACSCDGATTVGP